MILDVLASFVAIAAVLFIPGYFATLAFFTKRGEIGAVERLTFSFVFSVTLMPLFVLFENQVLGIPINFASVAGTFVLIIVLGLLAYLARASYIPLPQKISEFLKAVPKEQAFPILPI